MAKPVKSDIDKNIYIRKSNGRYEPIGYHFSSNNDWFTEGVWVVCKHRNSKSISNGDYLKKSFGIEKCSELANITFAELGGLEKIVDEVISKIEPDFWTQGFSVYDTVRRVLGETYKISKTKKETEE